MRRAGLKPAPVRKTCCFSDRNPDTQSFLFSLRRCVAASAPSAVEHRCGCGAPREAGSPRRASTPALLGTPWPSTDEVAKARPEQLPRAERREEGQLAYMPATSSSPCVKPMTRMTLKISAGPTHISPCRAPTAKPARGPAACSPSAPTRGSRRRCVHGPGDPRHLVACGRNPRAAIRRSPALPSGI